MKKIWYLLILWFIAGAFMPINADIPSDFNSEDIWLPSAEGNISGDPLVTMNILNDQSFEITVSFPGVWASVYNNEYGDYTSLFLDRYGHAGNPGVPDLPVFTTQLEIPVNSVTSLKILEIKTGIIKLSDKKLPDKIMPVQSPSPKSGPQPPWVPPDEQVYSRDQLYPENPVRLLPVYAMRAHTLLPVQFFPVQYQPSSGELILIQQITIQVNLDTDGDPKSVLNSRLADPEFDALVNKSILNPQRTSNPVADSSIDIGSGYLIIAPDDYLSALQPLVNLKIYEGYKVTVVSLTDIGASTTTAIKSYIQNAYNNWTTPPAYLLLVGDTNTIPAWISAAYEIRETKGTDLYYATMNGIFDFIPDIFVGRLPARSTQQLSDMINKIVSYAIEDGTESWVKKAAFIATCDSTYYPIAEATHNTIINNYTQPLGYTGNFPSIGIAGGDQLYCRTNSAFKADIVTAINDQRSLITYSGHGATLSWTDFSFTQTTVRDLSDNQIYPLVASFACETNDFANSSFPEVFGETWMLQSQKGAVSFIGSVDFSYWDQDDRLEKGLYEHLFNEPSDPSTISSAIHYGLERVQVFFPGSSQYYWETYNLLGDPSTRIWLGPRTADFWMTPESSEVSVCTGNQSVNGIDVTSINNFSEEVTLSIQNLPTSVTGWLTPTSLFPTSSTELTIAAAADAIPDVYPILVQGAGGGITHDLPLSLSINDIIPETVTLMLPLDDSTTPSTTPTLQWQPASQTFHYELQVATDFLFTNLVVNRQDLTDTSFTTQFPLESNTVYFWRVRAVNACGSSSYSTVFRFETPSQDGDCRSPELTQILYQNNFDNEVSDWAINSTEESFTWKWENGKSLTPGNSFYAFTPDEISDQRLTSPPVLIPEDSQLSTLSFWHWRDIEPSTAGCFDAGLIEYSTNGTTWNQISSDWIYGDPGLLLISNNLSNPLGGKLGWCGAYNWQKTIMDVSTLQGQSVQFRFRVGTDTSNSREGWYIDNFRLQSCQVLYRFNTETLLTEQDQLSGLSATYPITITNNGDPDTYLIEIDGNLWDTEISLLPELDYLEMATLYVTVNVPPGLLTGEYDELSLTITSTNDPSQFEEIILTTTAIENHPVYLPSILN
jgi:hypothetical protein